MESIRLALYDSFSCLAGKCTSTCCAGWRIFVHTKDYERFEKLDNKKLSKDILSHIEKKTDGYYFINKEDGHCSMLDEDGLCRIQRNTSEQMLCNTCRKYPRLIQKNENMVYLSMAASCPVVSKMLVEGNVQWIQTEKNEKKTVSIYRMPLVKNIYEEFHKNEEVARELQKQKKNTELLLLGFEKLSEEIFEIILKFKEGQYLLEDLTVFEQETIEENTLHCLEAFAVQTREVWTKLYSNYIQYALLTKTIEQRKEAHSLMCCVCGELLCIRMLAFGRYCKKGKLTIMDWQDVIQKTYRFCVHGKKVREEMDGNWENFFMKSYLWNYVLGSNGEIEQEQMW